MTSEEIGQLLGPALGMTLLIALFWGAWRSRLHKIARLLGNGFTDDDPADEPYRIFTEEFDLEIGAADVAERLIGASPDYAKNWLQLGNLSWDAALAQADKIFDRASQEAPALREKLETKLNVEVAQDAIVILLIDQSGSMRGMPMAHAAASARLACELLAGLGVKTEILGYSTAGWHGGFAAIKWQGAGKPKRPGRLCALLHIVYKSSEESSLSKDSWRAMLNRNILRENIDGEALAWAISRLRARPETKKILLIISDGAPVDDMTLTHNGPSYLFRHFEKVTSAARLDLSMIIGGIGIGYDVANFYQPSVKITDAAHLPYAVVDILTQLLGDANSPPKPDVPA